MNDDRGRELDDLKTKLMKENHFLKSLASKPLSVYFDAYRTKAYDGGGEENLTFQVKYFFCNFKNCWYPPRSLFGPPDRVLYALK